MLALLGRSDASRAGRTEDQAVDRRAIRRVAQGEGDALAEIYDRHARSLYGLVLRIVDDQAEAEDVVQEIFAQVWRQAGRYDEARGPVAAWLLTIARTRAIDRLRARRVRPEAVAIADDRPLPEVADPAAAPDLAALTGERVDRLRTALAGLPLVQRLAIELAYYEGLTQAEIAERLEQPLGTVKTRIRLGLMKLRDALAGEQA